MINRTVIRVHPDFHQYESLSRLQVHQCGPLCDLMCIVAHSFVLKDDQPYPSWKYFHYQEHVEAIVPIVEALYGSWPYRFE